MVVVLVPQRTIFSINSGEPGRANLRDELKNLDGYVKDQ